MIDQKILQLKGELQVQRERQRELSVSADVIIKGMIVGWDPMDMDCKYVSEFDVQRMKILFNDLLKKRTALDTVNNRIKQLESQLGNNAD